MHTRAEAEAQGFLVDLMKPPYIGEVEQAGYVLPVAIAREAFDRYVIPDPAADEAGEDLLLRLWDVLWMGRAAANSGAPPGSVVPFSLRVTGHGVVTLTFSIRELADGPYVLINMPPENGFRFILVEDGQLHVQTWEAPPTFQDMTRLVGGGIEGVPIPAPTADSDVIGYCHSNGNAEGLGANCYIIGLRYPIPGNLLIFGRDDGDGHRSLSSPEIAALSMRAVVGRRLPTLWVDGYEEPMGAGDPAVHDPYEPGKPFPAPPASIQGFDDHQ
jgi:hypothetical protein